MALQVTWFSKIYKLLLIQGVVFIINGDIYLGASKTILHGLSFLELCASTTKTV